MKFLVVLCVFVAFAASVKGSSNFIVGGDDASIEEYPYMASVLNLGFSSCGGTIISSRSVLTAAHCILFNFAPSVSVITGSSRRRGQGGQRYRAIRIFIHPDYVYQPEPFFLQADIAVIRTFQTISFGSLVQPIPLGTEFVPSNAQVVLTGWGLLGDSFWRDRADQLQRLDMTAISNLVCSVLYNGTPAEGNITPEKLCVLASNNRGACGGDSGGPITYQGTVVGVVSWGLRPCGSSPTVFIRVAHHLQWINEQL